MSANAACNHLVLSLSIQSPAYTDDAINIVFVVMQDFNFFQGTGSGSLARLTGETGPWFNSTACSNYDTFFFIYNSCNESVSLTYEVSAARHFFKPLSLMRFCSSIPSHAGMLKAISQATQPH